MAKMNSVVHFEWPARDKYRMMEFDSKMFDWEMQEPGADMRRIRHHHLLLVNRKRFKTLGKNFEVQ